ncbi:flavin reductase family protein [Flaviflagellibacter deserti]|uniref:Flavin reductase family protein n=1 Tax=Flaviflagellibacter deserti TaxID=2267266 RepID=A0ABV9Z1M6_9HYPH
MNPVDADRFRDAMSMTASGVTVVTTNGEAGRLGVTVSTLCSLSLEPPSVVLCIHRDSRALPAIVANGVFVANVLGSDQQRVADTFAGRVPELKDNRFGEGEWHALATGAPVLRGSLCSFDCRVAEIFEFGSHRIIAGIVVDLACAGTEPLVHANRSYQKLQAA